MWKLSILCVLAVGMLGCVMAAVDLNADLRTMAQMLPGLYSNNLRRHGRSHKVPVIKDGKVFPESPVPVDALSTMHVTAVFRPVNVTFLQDSFNVYVEQTLYGHQKPHRQWIYSFSVDQRYRAIKLQMYSFKEDSLGEKISKNPRATKYLGESDVTTRSECDMHWRKLGTEFVGSLSRRCVGMMDQTQVRIAVVMTLTSGSLQIDEGWYNARDGSKLTELDGPIFLSKTEAIADNPFLHPEQEEPVAEPLKAGKHVADAADAADAAAALQKDGRMKRHKNPSYTHNDIPDPPRHGHQGSIYPHGHRDHLPRQPYASNVVPDSEPEQKHYHNVGDKFSFNEVKKLNSIIRKAGFKNRRTDSKTGVRYEGSLESSKKNINSKQKSTWNLQSYGGVLDALVSGHKVYFTARTKRCSHKGVPVKERSMFGDYVQMFEIGKDFSEKQPYTYLSFSYKRMEQSRSGFQEVVKHITVHRNGTVHIAAVYVNEDGDVSRQTYSTCTLYDQDRGKGDVRFYLDPYRDVASLARFKSLRSALQKGKMVRITTDMDKCSGGKADHVIIGGELRSYDLGRNGRAIDVTLSMPKIVLAPNNAMSLEEEYFIFRFYKQGETTLIRHSKTMISQTQNYSIVTGYLKYKCEIDANASTKAISLYNS